MYAFEHLEWFYLDTEQLPQTGISSVSTTKHIATADQLLADARTLYEQLAVESMEVNHKFSEAVLAVIMYTEKVENASHLLALVDSCIGQIRSRMHAHRIPINLPSLPSNTVTVSDVNAVTIQGKSIHMLW